VGEELPHIAVVDDDQSIRDALCNLVNAIGYSAEAFASAEAFVASDQFRKASCVIADVQMPGMSGVELLKRLAAERATIPVILVTAFPQEATRELALRNGAIGYLAKPLREETLVACLEEALGA